MVVEAAVNPRTPPSRSRLLRVGRPWAMALQGVCMWLTIIASFALGFASNGVVAIWPAAGFGVTMAIYYGAWSLPFIAGASFAYTLAFQDENLAFYFLTGTGNALACVLGAALYRRVGGPKNPMKTVGGIVKLVVVLAFSMSVIAASLGVIVISFAYSLPAELLIQVGWRWFFSDFTGAVLVAPALLAVFGSWRRIRRRFWTMLARQTWVPTLVCAASLALLYLATGYMPDGLGQYPTVLLTMPLCVWLALRGHTPSSMLLLTVTVIGSLALTLSATGDASESAFLAVQLYGLVAMCTSLVLHASTAERKRALSALDSERQSLERAVKDRTAELRQQIKANKDANAKLALLATTDPLTGLANRRAFMDTAKREIARCRRNRSALSVVMLDIDFFKKINDRHGHAAGDAVLVSLAAALRHGVRDGIDLVARLGGEEFVCLLPDTNVEQALEFAQRTRESVERMSLEHEGQALKITASLGVSSFTAEMGSIEDALQMADNGLYQAKQTGRNQVGCCQKATHPVEAPA
ncbi:MAG: diguanylate cyclase [Pseudomonadota bacterium]